VLFSGVYFNLPERVEVLVKPFSPIIRNNPWSGISAADFPSQVALGQQPVSFSAVEAAVQQLSTEGRLWLFYAPQDEKGSFVIQKRDDDNLSRFVGYRDFIVDQYSGKIKAEYASGRGTAGDVLLDWQWPLHSGQAFGWTGRILVALSGLVCPVLWVTGVLRWLHKRNAKAKSNVKKRF
jgi:uncharacterized iron-regulated membrane protein